MKLLACVLLALPLWRLRDSSPIDRLIDRIFDREKVLLDSMRQRTPLIETYIQETPEAVSGDGPTRITTFWALPTWPTMSSYEALVDRTDAVAPH